MSGRMKHFVVPMRIDVIVNELRRFYVIRMIGLKLNTISVQNVDISAGIQNLKMSVVLGKLSTVTYIFDKNFVKAVVLLKKLLKSWFHEIFFLVGVNFSFFDSVQICF